jgi:hypothetical protein
MYAVKVRLFLSSHFFLIYYHLTQKSHRNSANAAAQRRRRSTSRSSRRSFVSGVCFLSFFYTRFLSYFRFSIVLWHYGTLGFGVRSGRRRFLGSRRRFWWSANCAFGWRRGWRRALCGRGFSGEAGVGGLRAPRLSSQEVGGSSGCELRLRGRTRWGARAIAMRPSGVLALNTLTLPSGAGAATVVEGAPTPTPVFFFCRDV